MSSESVSNVDEELGKILLEGRTLTEAETKARDFISSSLCLQNLYLMWMKNFEKYFQKREHQQKKKLRQEILSPVVCVFRICI